jgi:hypothetical protein
MSPAPTEAIAGARCTRHANRQAAARCPGCRRNYCRECVTEHGGRLLCQSCLDVAARTDSRARPETGLVRRAARAVGRVSSLCAALVAAWLAFYCLGRLLLLLPTGSSAAIDQGAPADPSSPPPAATDPPVGAGDAGDAGEPSVAADGEEGAP